MRTAAKAVVLMAGGVPYWYDDEYLVAASSFANPRAGDKATNAVLRTTNQFTPSDANGKFSIANGTLIGASGANNEWVTAASLARVPGLAMIWQVTRTGGTANKELIIGWESTGTFDVSKEMHAFYLSSTSLIAYANNGTASSAGIGTIADSTVYTCAIVLLSSGALYFIKGGTLWTDWTLVFIEHSVTTTPLYPMFYNFTASFTSDFIRVPVALSYIDTQIAVVNQASPVSGTIYPAAANVQIEATFALPGSPASGDLVEVRYRMADATNYMLARIQWNSGTSHWDFVTGHVINGTETLQGTPVANIGNAVEIQISADGNFHRYFTKTGNLWSGRYAQITDATGATNTGTAMVSVNSTLTTLWAAPKRAPYVF